MARRYIEPKCRYYPGVPSSAVGSAWVAYLPIHALTRKRNVLVCATPKRELHSPSLSLMVTSGLGGSISTKVAVSELNSPLIVNISSPSRMKSSVIAKKTTDDVTSFT